MEIGLKLARLPTSSALRMAPLPSISETPFLDSLSEFRRAGGLCVRFPY